MHPSITKTIMAALAGIAALTLQIPPPLQKSAIVALAFLVLDTVTGYVCAAFDKGWSSHVMRLKLVAKCAQYAVLIGCSAGASFLAGTWTFLLAAWWAVIAIEFHSNVENLIKWQAFGVNMGPASQLLQKLSGFFAAGQVTPETPQIVVPTVIGAKPKEAAGDPDQSGSQQ